MRRVVAELTDRIETLPDEFPRLAVNALKTLGYKPDMHDKYDNKLIYYDACEETYGSESWRCLYQALIYWTDLNESIEITIQIREKNYGEDHIDICVDRVTELWNEIQKIVLRAKHLKPKDPTYKARFTNIQDLNDNELINFDRDLPKDISTKFIIGTLEGKTLALTERMTHRHVLVCGPTGSGKSMSIFIPNLINRVGSSAIVTEAVSGNGTPVLYGNTAGWRANAGHEIVYFNPADLTSSRINPIDQVKSFDDAQHLAHLIVTNTTAESHVGDQVWSQSETHLLQSLLLHVAGFRTDISKPSTVGDNANLGYVRQLLTRGPEGMQEELSNTRLSIARREYMAYLNCTSPNFRYGVISGLMMRLNLFVDPKIAALTEITDFSINDLKKKLFTIYLATPVHKSEYTPIAVLMFNFCLSVILQDLDSFVYPMTILADEFTNFGYLPNMPRYMTVIRNAGIGIVLGIQDPVQLERVYREKDARILFGQPRTKIFFAPADDLVAFRFSKMLGTRTERENVAASGQMSNYEIPRPLIDTAELMQLEKENRYICQTATNVLKLEPMRSWDVYRGPTSYQPPHRAKIVVIEDFYNESQSSTLQATKAIEPIDDLNSTINTSIKIKSGEESYWDQIAREALNNDQDLA